MKNLKKVKFLYSVGRMYINSRGVDMYTTNDADFICLVPKNARTDSGLKYYKNTFVTKEYYEKYIENDIDSLELESALKFCEIK